MKTAKEIDKSNLPVAVIGAGPIGLAAAVHLVSRGKIPIVFESGDSVGANVLKWGHVRMFSEWKHDIDSVAKEMLKTIGWQEPEPEHLPTGRELFEQYLKPLSELPQIKPHLRTRTKVVSVTRQGFGKIENRNRENKPFEIRFVKPGGEEDSILVGAVIDASGTYKSPNPLGAGGSLAIGEKKLAEHIFYGIPDVKGNDLARYQNKNVMVVGGGHSAMNVLLDLVSLIEKSWIKKVIWITRNADFRKSFGDENQDNFPARALLGSRVSQLVENGDLYPVTDFRISKIISTKEGIVVCDENDQKLPPVNEIISTTGFRPDLSILSELRLDLDSSIDCPKPIAPLIDPNIQSCGTVEPHGAVELKHPEKDFYIVGMKSYGRAPTFFISTGYGQVRSVVAAIAGDWEEAANMRNQDEIETQKCCSVSDCC